METAWRKFYASVHEHRADLRRLADQDTNGDQAVNHVEFAFAEAPDFSARGPDVIEHATYAAIRDLVHEDADVPQLVRDALDALEEVEGGPLRDPVDDHNDAHAETYARELGHARRRPGSRRPRRDPEG